MEVSKTVITSCAYHGWAYRANYIADSFYKSREKGRKVEASGKNQPDANKK